MSDHPYRPLFVETDDVKVQYTLTPEELREAIIDFVEKKLDAGVEGYPSVYVGSSKGEFVMKPGNQYLLEYVTVTLIEEVK